MQFSEWIVFPSSTLCTFCQRSLSRSQSQSMWAPLCSAQICVCTTLHIRWVRCVRWGNAQHCVSVRSPGLRLGTPVVLCRYTCSAMRQLTRRCCRRSLISWKDYRLSSALLAWHCELALPFKGKENYQGLIGTIGSRTNSLKNSFFPWAVRNIHFTCNIYTYTYMMVCVSLCICVYVCMNV